MRNENCVLMLYFVRHAQSMGNADSENTDPSVVLDYDKENPSLSPLGFKQAEAVGKRFIGEKLTAMYSSPYLRTKQTAQTILKYADCETFLDNRLTEICSAQTETGFCEFDESPQAIRLRADAFLSDIRRQYTNGEKILVVSHGGFIGSMIFEILNIREPSVRMCVYNASVSKINFFKDGTIKIAMLNDTAHIWDVEEDRMQWM